MIGAGAHPCSRGALVLLLAFLLVPGAWTQIVTENAGVVSPETPILRESLSFLDAENLREVRWTSQILFAPDTSRELRLALPLVGRDLRFEDAAGADHDADLLGLGDATLRFKQSLWQRDEVMASTRWAFLAELGAPTGDADAQEDGLAIPRRLQLGTGDWSLGAGSAFTWIRDRRRFSAEALYRHRTRHEGIRLGPEADLNLAWWYRLHPSAFAPGEETTEVRGVLEMLSSYRFASEIGDDRAGDDGLLVSLAPGIQVYPGTRVLFEANVQVPIYQDLDDAAGDRHWAATVALKFLF